MRPTGDFAEVNRLLDLLITYENSEGVIGERDFHLFTLHNIQKQEHSNFRVTVECVLSCHLLTLQRAVSLFCASASPSAGEEHCHNLTSSHYCISVDQQILPRRSEWVFHLLQSSYFVDDELYTPSRHRQISYRAERLSG